MANIKITDLTAYGDPTSTDVLPIVDVGADATKKVSVANLIENAGSGTASAPGIAFDGDPDTGIYRPGDDQLALVTNGTERLFVNGSGDVGLGTDDPLDFLHLLAGNLSNTDTNSINNFIRITDLNSRNNGSQALAGNFRSGIRFDATQLNGAKHYGSFIQQVVTSNNFTGGSTKMRTALIFGTRGDVQSAPEDDPVERMRINSEGDVLIGTATTISQSTSTGSGARFNSSGRQFLIADDGTALFIGRNTSDGDTVDFRRAGVQVGSISVTASATAYNTSSDYRLKENIVPTTGAADRLNQLQVRRFNFISDPDTTVDGFLAHEAQAVVPGCVTGTKDEVDDEGNPVYQGIDQSKLVPLLTAALQEALGRIETLEAEVAALKAH